MRIIAIAIVLVFITMYIVLMPRMLFKRDVLSLKYLTFEIVMQNFICILCCSYLNSFISQLVLLYKEIIFYGAVILYFIYNKKMKIRKNSLYAIAMILVCLPYFFIGEASLYTKLVCFRQIMTPVILILYGRTLLLTENDFVDYFRFLVKIGIALVFFGFIEELVIGDDFWIALHIEKYMDMKGFSAWAWDGLPGNFYSADLHLTIGMLRRMVSIMADPLLTGHFLAFCVVILLYKKLFENNLLNMGILFLLTVGVVLTLSKGAILVIAIAFAYKLWRNNKLFAIPFILVGIIMLVFMIKNNVLYSISQHTSGLVSSSIRVVGKGLGSVGNYANLYGNANSDISESYIGALLGQMGLMGVVMFLCVFIHYSKKILSVRKSRVSILVFAYVLGVILEAFMSESSINFVGSGVTFILFGSLTNDLICNSMTLSDKVQNRVQ